jgi:hypothetical protein
MSGHTSGPWTTNGVVVSARVEFSQRNICEMNPSAPTGGRAPDDRSRAEMIANARLISSAPALLEAVQDLLGIIHSVCPEYDEATMCANARAALALAEGGVS